MRTLKEQREESDHEDEEDTDDAAVDPVEDGDKVIASGLSTNELPGIRVLADDQLRVQGSQEHHWKDHISTKQTWA